VAMTTATVYEVARSLGIDVKQVLDWYSVNDWDIPSANSTLTQEQVIAVRDAFKTSGEQVGSSRVRQEILGVEQVANQILGGVCACCGVEPLPTSSAKAPDDLPKQPPKFCSACLKHLGGDAPTLTRKNDKHKELWRSAMSRALSNAKRDCENLVSRLNSEVEGIREELANRPEVFVYEDPDQEKVDEADYKRDRAFRYRDEAFAALSLVKAWHRAAGEKTCRCGLILTKCKTHDLVTSDEALAKWERKQYERHIRGERHTFPPEHPARTDPSWRPDG